MAFINSIMAVTAVLLATMSTTVCVFGLNHYKRDQRICQFQNHSEISCQIRSASDLQIISNDLSIVQFLRIAKFRLHCFSDEDSNDQGLVLQENLQFFTKLTNLRDLQIFDCKFKDFTVLQTIGETLQSLRVNTNNAYATSSNDLVLSADSFRRFANLKSLNLASNNIWSLPNEVFCQMQNLQVLNLSRNKLQDIDNLAFSDWGLGPLNPGLKKCNRVLEKLDLSHNELSGVEDNSLSSLRNLQNLYLQNNKLKILEDRSFVGLNSLQVLNVSCNKLIALPPELFQYTRILTQIYLQNNSLTVLAPGLLEGLDRLQILDLSRNELNSVWVNKDTFSGLIRLVVLNLSRNKLTKIDSQIFKDLYSLQILSLDNNLISSISENAFEQMKNLHALTLSSNLLKSIETKHFTGLYVLNQLFLDQNRLEYIEDSSFENMTNLHDLSLNDNVLKQVPKAIQKLRFLKSLDLGKNRITSLINESFDGLDQLYGLRLVDNLITNITRDTFMAIPSLQVLNLGSNLISYIEQSAFMSNPTIKAIRLDGNFLEDISGVFTSLPGLVWLNVSNNHITNFDYSHLPLSLEWLDIHNNRIQELSNYYNVKNLVKIKMLDASFNSLRVIRQNSVPDSIETIFLNDNHIDTVEVNSFLNKTNLEKVVLNGNNLRNLSVQSLRTDFSAKPRFYLSQNPFLCDCTMQWLSTYKYELQSTDMYPQIADLDAIRCETVFGQPAMRDLSEMRTKDFLCKYETHCYPLCHCCDFDACDCEMTCPENCACFHDETWNTNIVDCSGPTSTGNITRGSDSSIADLTNNSQNNTAQDVTQGRTRDGSIAVLVGRASSLKYAKVTGRPRIEKIPKNIPMDASEIYLDGNNFTKLDEYSFIGKKKLKILYLNHSSINEITENTFNGLENLQILHLQGNNLTRFATGREFDKLINLQELYLHDNNLEYIANDTFNKLYRLKTLTLHGNGLVDFIPQVPNDLVKISMPEAGYKCGDCNTLRGIVVFLRQKTIANLDLLRCIDITDSSLQKAFEVCETAETKRHQQKYGYEKSVKGDDNNTSNRTVLTTEGHGLISVLAAVVVCIIGISFLFALVFAFRQDVKLWLHSKYGLRFPKSNSAQANDLNKLYDAYVLYSKKDSNLISNILSTNLEENGFNLCLHYRDLHNSEQILTASNVSKKIIIVLSHEFLKTEWSRTEYRCNLQNLLEKHEHLQKNKVILILTASAESLRILDPVIEVLLRTCTVIYWGERRFWAKLRYFLPDPVSDLSKFGKDFKRSPNLRYTAAPGWFKTQNLRQYEDEDSSLSTASTLPQYEIPINRQIMMDNRTGQPNNCQDGCQEIAASNSVGQMSCGATDHRQINQSAMDDGTSRQNSCTTIGGSECRDSSSSSGRSSCRCRQQQQHIVDCCCNNEVVGAMVGQTSILQNNHRCYCPNGHASNLPGQLELDCNGVGNISALQQHSYSYAIGGSSAVDNNCPTVSYGENGHVYSTIPEPGTNSDNTTRTYFV